MILVRACRIRKTLIRDFIRRPRLLHFCAHNCIRSLNESEQKRQERIAIDGDEMKCNKMKLKYKIEYATKYYISF